MTVNHEERPEEVRVILVQRLDEVFVRAMALAAKPDNLDPAAALMVAVEAVRGMAEVARLGSYRK
jgi:hypothetical protein